jgi:hypothetical protein
MCKSISVYSHDSNPAIDLPLFRISRHEATIRLDKGFVLPLSPNTRPAEAAGRMDNGQDGQRCWCFVQRSVATALVKLLAGLATDGLDSAHDPITHRHPGSGKGLVKPLVSCGHISACLSTGE